MVKFREQAEKYDVPIVNEDVVTVSRQGHCFQADTGEGKSYSGASVILAVGRERRKLGLEHEEEWTGRGISYCSTCDAPLHRGNMVGVVGGGDAAVKGAVLLGRYARRVYVFYRRERFTRPEAVNLSQLEASANVEPVFSTNVVGLKGDDGLSGVVLDRPFNGSTEVDLDGLFIEIGADPRVELANQLGVSLNEQGEIEVDLHGRTSEEGVFAAGDVTNASGRAEADADGGVPGSPGRHGGLRLPVGARQPLLPPQHGIQHGVGVAWDGGGLSPLSPRRSKRGDFRGGSGIMSPRNGGAATDLQPDQLGIQDFDLLDGESVRAHLGLSEVGVNGAASQPDAMLLTETRVIHIQGNGRRRRAVFASVRDIDSAEIGHQHEGYGAFLWAALSFVIAALLYFVIDNQMGSIAASAIVAAMGIYLVVDRVLSRGRSLLIFSAGGSEVPVRAEEQPSNDGGAGLRQPPLRGEGRSAGAVQGRPLRPQVAAERGEPSRA